MKKFVHLFLFGIFWLLIFSQTAMGQESGWAGDGLIKFQKFPTDTIVKYGLSANGDTLKTFHKDFKLYYWDIISGNLLKEKQLPDGVKVSEDMLTYFIYTDSSNNGYGQFVADVELFDIYSDNLVHKSRLLRLQDENASRYTSKIDFDSKFNKFYLVLHYHVFLGYATQEYEKSFLLKIVGESINIVNEKVNLSSNMIYNHNKDKIAILKYYSSSSAREEYDNRIRIFSIWNTNSDKGLELSSSSNFTIIEHRNPRFLNDDNKVSAFVGQELHIYDINSKTIIQKQTPIVKKPWLFDYLYMREDKFLAYSNDKIFVYDMNSKRIIDSSEAVSTNKSTVLLYSGTQDKLCFYNNDKFGIADFKMLNTNFDLQISVDSTHVYAGNPYNVYLYGLPDGADVSWETSDGLTSSERNPIFTFKDEGSKSFTVTVTHNTQTYKKTFENVVNVLTTLFADFDSDVRFGSAPMVVKFRNLSTGSNLTYEWNFGNGKTSTEKDPIILYDSSGRYHVSLKIKDSLNAKINIKSFYIQIDSDIYEPLDARLSNIMIGSDFIAPDKEIYSMIISPIGSVINKERIVTTYFEYDRIFQSRNAKVSYFDNQLNLKHGINHSPGSFSSLKLLIDYDNFFIYAHPHSNLYVYKCYYADSNNQESAILPLTSCLHKISNGTFLITKRISIEQTIISKYAIDFNPIKETDTMNAYYLAASSNSDLDKIYLFGSSKEGNNDYFYDLIDSNLTILSRIYFEIVDNIRIQSFELVNDKYIIFVGSIIKDSVAIAIVGVYNLDGSIVWKSDYKNWHYFNKILVERNSFLATGSNLANSPGFIKINLDGTKFKDYRSYDNKVDFTSDLDIVDSNHILLTYRKNKIYHCLVKFEYDPKFADTPADTTKPQDSINKINRVTVYPNPAKGEVKFSFKEKVSVREIQLFNTDGVMVERKVLSPVKISEYSFNIDKLAIGIYFVKIYTDSGVIETKFIKGE